MPSLSGFLICIQLFLHFSCDAAFTISRDSHLISIPDAPKESVSVLKACLSTLDTMLGTGEMRVDRRLASIPENSPLEDAHWETRPTVRQDHREKTIAMFHEAKELLNTMRTAPKPPSKVHSISKEKLGATQIVKSKQERLEASSSSSHRRARLERGDSQRRGDRGQKLDNGNSSNEASRRFENIDILVRQSLEEYIHECFEQKQWIVEQIKDSGMMEVIPRLINMRTYMKDYPDDLTSHILARWFDRVLMDALARAEERDGRSFEKPKGLHQGDQNATLRSALSKVVRGLEDLNWNLDGNHLTYELVKFHHDQNHDVLDTLHTKSISGSLIEVESYIRAWKQVNHDLGNLAVGHRVLEPPPFTLRYRVRNRLRASIWKTFDMALWDLLGAEDFSTIAAQRAQILHALTELSERTHLAREIMAFKESARWATIPEARSKVVIFRNHLLMNLNPAPPDYSAQEATLHDLAKFKYQIRDIDLIVKLSGQIKKNLALGKRASHMPSRIFQMLLRKVCLVANAPAKVLPRCWGSRFRYERQP